MILRHDIKGLIFDLDGTMYAFPAEKDVIFSDAASRAAIQFGFQGTYEEAFAAAQRSWAAHKSEIAVFTLEHGIPHHDIYGAMHDLGSTSLIAHVPPDAALTAAFNCLAGKLEIAILTHATQLWATRLVQHLGYDGVLKPDRILAIDHPSINYYKKDQGPDSFLAAAAALNLSPHEIAVIDDTGMNFISAHALGMQTILVHGGKPLATLPDYIDGQVSSFAELEPPETNACGSAPPVWTP